MKKTSYKFWYIKRDDDVHISEATIRFYEGDITTVNVMDLQTKIASPVTAYRREKRLQAADLDHLGKRKIIKELCGDDCAVYTPKDFGVISTEAELAAFVNRELKKDKKRAPIDDQK